MQTEFSSPPKAATLKKKKAVTVFLMKNGFHNKTGEREKQK